VPIVRAEAGSTPPGSTNWKPYGNNIGVFVDVDATAAGFGSTPKYFTGLGGNTSHWRTTGATSIYNATSTGFRVHVRWADGSTLTPAKANSLQWHINWLGLEVA
jgi:hypothetical protein